MGLEQAHSEVTGMLHAGTPFHAIEEQIYGIPGLLDDERSALWLYAWSHQARDWQHRASTQILLWVRTEEQAAPAS
jgi:rhamnogalacturonyl hydrolase YesR